MADEEEVDIKNEVSDEQEIARVKALDAEVKQLISRNSAAQALKVAAQGLPPQGKAAQAKSVAVDAFLSIFSMLDRTAADGLLGELSEEERLTVLKYAYKCMEVADKKTCENLLLWHAKIIAKDGQGAILRVFADKKV